MDLFINGLQLKIMLYASSLALHNSFECQIILNYHSKIKVCQANFTTPTMSLFCHFDDSCLTELCQEQVEKKLLNLLLSSWKKLLISSS